MNVLIIGHGGREHALAWKIRQSPRAERVFVAPGNGGTALEPGIDTVALGADATDDLIRFAREHAIGLTIVGPEAPLVAGLSDAFAAAGLPCLGPSRAAARLEGSKVFAKDFLQRHGIPTALYRSFTEVAPALDYLSAINPPAVIKADGLAAGKGVILAADRPTAEAAIRDMLQGGRFGGAGRALVIEEFLVGEEASFIALVDGEHILPLASSQDHKARDAGDQGPNTGGMGAYSPAPVVTPDLETRILRDIMVPTIAGLRAEGILYRGFLYAGLMIDASGQPRVLEFNCRLGDPETQPILMRLRSDLLELCSAAMDQRLDGFELAWDSRAALGVVVAASGYPDEYRRGDPIAGLDDLDDSSVKAFHAGTRLDGGRLVTDGGRVLCVTALGDSIAAARARAYTNVDRIAFAGAFHRRDIGHRALGSRISSSA